MKFVYLKGIAFSYMMNLQQPVWIKSAVSDFLCRSHLVENDCLLQTLGMCKTILLHIFFRFGPSLLWPMLPSSWAEFTPLLTTMEAVPIITKSFLLLLCQYTRYTILCWAKPLQKLKLHTHASYTWLLIYMRTHNSSNDRPVFLLKLK